jgi:hypothetical protein
MCGRVDATVEFVQRSHLPATRKIGMIG